MGRLSGAIDRTFRSLRSPNYRLYFFGQIVSLTGTWMQSVAQAWLVLRLTGSGLALGTTAALQFAPILVAGPWGGVIADRVDKRRLIIWTQSAAGALALVLGLLTLENVGEFRGWNGGTYFPLENGQVWRQAGTENNEMPPVEHAEVSRQVLGMCDVLETEAEEFLLGIADNLAIALIGPEETAG